MYKFLVSTSRISCRPPTHTHSFLPSSRSLPRLCTKLAGTRELWKLSPESSQRFNIENSAAAASRWRVSVSVLRPRPEVGFTVVAGVITIQSTWVCVHHGRHRMWRRITNCGAIIFSAAPSSQERSVPLFYFTATTPSLYVVEIWAIQRVSSVAGAVERKVHPPSQQSGSSSLLEKTL